MPASAKQPDRLWLALSAYNLGMGHLNGARFVATLVKRDPNSWYEMKQVLPLLAKELGLTQNELNKVVESGKRDKESGGESHVQNFVSSVRSRQVPNAEIEQ